MKTFIANETLLLIDGEVYLLSNENYSIGNWCYDTANEVISLFQDSLPKYHYMGYIKIIASTKQLPNVKQLPREVFVKGGDVKIEAEKFLPKVYSEWEYELFEAGYNTNKNEFTKGQLTESIKLAYRYGQGNVRPLLQTIGIIFNEFEPKLQLPKSITTNDELEIISVMWK